MSRFVANPEQLTAQGNRIVDLAGQFNKNIDEIYKIVDEMVQSNYSSAEAREIANKIGQYKEILLNMRNRIENYGNYLRGASNAIITNQEEIIAGIRGGSVG